ncbi:MAG TPA: FkbM family methyltransferase [Tepidisphaeraceae bacterium]|jgi:FkbM family methyltransferase
MHLFKTLYETAARARYLPVLGMSGIAYCIESMLVTHGLLKRRAEAAAFEIDSLGGTVFLRRRTTDWLVAGEIIFKGEYDAIAALNLSDVRHVVDLGANIGLSVRYWQKLFPVAEILAVEPEAENFRLLLQNVAGGPDPLRVRAFQCGIGGSTRTAHLDMNRNDWDYRVLDHPQAGSRPVRVLSLPELLDETRWHGPIDLLKCDVEGAEEELFDAAAPWLNRVRYMIVELHGRYDATRFEAALKKAGGDFKVSDATDRNKRRELLLCTNQRTPQAAA